MITQQINAVSLMIDNMSKIRNRRSWKRKPLHALILYRKKVYVGEIMNGYERSEGSMALKVTKQGV